MYISTFNKVSILVLRSMDIARRFVSALTVIVGKEDWIFFILNFLETHFAEGLIVLREQHMHSSLTSKYNYVLSGTLDSFCEKVSLFHI